MHCMPRCLCVIVCKCVWHVCDAVSHCYTHAILMLMQEIVCLRIRAGSMSPGLLFSPTSADDESLCPATWRAQLGLSPLAPPAQQTRHPAGYGIVQTFSAVVGVSQTARFFARNPLRSTRGAKQARRPKHLYLASACSCAQRARGSACASPRSATPAVVALPMLSTSDQVERAKSQTLGSRSGAHTRSFARSWRASN